MRLYQLDKLQATKFIFLNIYHADKSCENLKMENKEIRKVNLSKLLNEHLQQTDATKAGFAEQCGLNPAQLSQVLGNEAFRNIGDRLARRIESSLKLPTGWLDSIHPDNIPEDEVEIAGAPAKGFVRVVGEALLGTDGSVDMMELHAGWLCICSKDLEAFGLKVKGDSMWPRIQSGEFVVIEPNTPVQVGDEVFVRTRDGRNMIKIFNKTRDGSYLFTSVNSQHHPITLAPDEIEKIQYVAAILKHTRFLERLDKVS